MKTIIATLAAVPEADIYVCYTSAQGGCTAVKLTKADFIDRNDPEWETEYARIRESMVDVLPPDEPVSAGTLTEMSDSEASPVALQRPNQSAMLDTLARAAVRVPPKHKVEIGAKVLASRINELPLREQVQAKTRGNTVFIQISDFHPDIQYFARVNDQPTDLITFEELT